MSLNPWGDYLGLLGWDRWITTEEAKIGCPPGTTTQTIRRLIRRFGMKTMKDDKGRLLVRTSDAWAIEDYLNHN